MDYLLCFIIEPRKAARSIRRLASTNLTRSALAFRSQESDICRVRGDRFMADWDKGWPGKMIA